MTDSIALLPCPFCGGEVKFEQTTEKEMPSLWWYIACSGEKCPMGSESLCLSDRRKTTASLWNTRAALSPVGSADVRQAFSAICSLPDGEGRKDAFLWFSHGYACHRTHAGSADKWQMVIEKDGTIWFSADDFDHDSALKFNGDFPSQEAKEAYARTILARLNSSTAGSGLTANSEPVAWRYEDERGFWRYVGFKPVSPSEPLYAAPPAVDVGKLRELVIEWESSDCVATCWNCADELRDALNAG